MKPAPLMSDTSTARRQQLDRLRNDVEVMSVLVALAPLRDRLPGVHERLLTHREFDVDEVLKAGWSSGERVLIQFAGVLWRGETGDLDASYLFLALGGDFFQACIDAIAVRRREHVCSVAAAAVDDALEGTAWLWSRVPA